MIPHLSALWFTVKKHIEAKNALFVGCRILWRVKSRAPSFGGDIPLFVNLNVGVIDDFSLLAFFFFGCFFHFCSPF